MAVTNTPGMKDKQAMAKKPLIAWHGDPEVKKTTVAEMEAHREADAFIQGTYWNARKAKGCCVGCLQHDGDHSALAERLGLPVALVRLSDTIFEGLPDGQFQQWPVRFFSAAKPGADLSLVQWQFLAFIVEEALSRKEADSVREACKPALDVVRAKARGEDVSESAAESAVSAARSAAWSAVSAESAAWSARSAAWSARSAAWSARSAASAARSAASAARSARSAAESAAWKRYADKLVELMAAAPVVRQ